MVNTSSLVNNTRNCETCFKADFTISDFCFRDIKSIAWFQQIQRRIQHVIWILIDHALSNRQ